jgi:hypothetical protein
MDPLFYSTTLLIALMPKIDVPPISTPNNDPQFGTPIWDPDLDPKYGPPFWTELIYRGVAPYLICAGIGHLGIQCANEH